uniref:Uncharacterized protein n=1 Tax=Rhizophora mucronata TaxID=61149 RepID=A0A2P2P845_RHIMU
MATVVFRIPFSFVAATIGIGRTGWLLALLLESRFESPHLEKDRQSRRGWIRDCKAYPVILSWNRRWKPREASLVRAIA